MNSTQVKERIESNLQGTCFVSEFSGSDDHYSVVIIAKEFTGKNKLQRHRIVMDLFRKEIDSGEVHALTMQTHSPDEWEKTHKS